MAQDVPPFVTNSQPDFAKQGEQFTIGSLEPRAAEKQQTFWRGVFSDFLVALLDFFMQTAGRLVVWVAKRFQRAEDANEPVFRELANTAIKDLTGVDGINAKAAAGKQMLDAITGGPGAAPGGRLEPSLAGAEHYMTMVMNLALEGYLETAMFQTLGFGFLNGFGELDDILSQTLGTGRITRQVVGPLLQARVITPATWHTNKQYRPELLGAGDAIRHYLRGGWTGEQLVEELARQGWSDERINVMVANATKRLSIDQALFMFNRGRISDRELLAYARDLGYDENTAAGILEIEKAQQNDRWNAPIVSDALAAFIEDTITEEECRRLVRGAAPNLTEADRVVSVAKVRKSLRVRKLSSGEARRLAVKRILSVADYRRALQRENYEPDAIAALEVELRMELGEQRRPTKADLSLSEMKALVLAGAEPIDAFEQLARDRGYDDTEVRQLVTLLSIELEAALERAEEKRVADEERAARRRELEDKAARTFPALGEYRRAVVRGLLPISSYTDELARLKYAPADIDFLRADAELDRAEYLAAAAKREAAESTAGQRDLQLADVRALVLRGTLAVSDYFDMAKAAGFDEVEAHLLTSLLEGELADRALAEERRRQREAELARKGISLGDLATAVRRGLATIADYDALLDAEGYPPIDRALLVELLNAQLADDEDARQRRAAAEAAATSKGIPLAALERAVRRGLRSMADYRAELNRLGLSLADQNTMVQLLEAELAEEHAARALREQVAAAPPVVGLSQSQIERAIRLGLLDMSAYRAHLAAKGYSGADVELLVALLVDELRDTRQAQERRAEIARELATRAISLGDFERAVRRGIKSLVEYEGLLFDSGYAAGDVALLKQLLAEELAIDLNALRVKLAGQLAGDDGAPALDALEAALLESRILPDDARAQLEAAGVTPDEALVFVRLVLNLAGTA